MYKKLLSFGRTSTDEISSSYRQIPELECPSCCCRSCCPLAPSCRLCSAALVLPSCVGAIRALQRVGANHACCTSGRRCTVPANDASTMAVMARTN
ncbi:hypothetical protein ACLKA7_017547 [Drosophila subpalustris]